MPTLGFGVAGTALAIAINFATDGRYGVWAWVAVGALTLVVFGMSLWLNSRQGAPTAPAARSFQVAGNATVTAVHNSVAALAIDTVNMGSGPSTGSSPQPASQQTP
ncbi:hypothetical protein [Nocardia sp. 2TAF39]|uniref:hypothetical protein n=1 Tax=Nocardia sp. 2TAF39 TaxID=3233017 RepID=UPI003F9B7654